MTNPELLEAILTSIDTLDKEMTNHSTNCFKCKEAPCKRWEGMVETWNFYNLALNRTLKKNITNVSEIPGYE